MLILSNHFFLNCMPPDYRLIGQGMNVWIREEWTHRPYILAGYLLVAVLWITGFVMAVVDAGATIHTTGLILIVVGLVIAAGIAVVRCRQAQSEGAQVVFV
jgi:hypothetical protein